MLEQQDLIDLKNLLETQYTDGITSITRVELDDNDNIVGIFEDKISPTVTKRYAFRIEDDAIAYKLLNPQSLDYLEDSLIPNSKEDPADYYTEQAMKQAAPIFESWVGQIETSLFDGAESLEEVRDRVEDLFPQLDSVEFAELMQSLLFSGYLAGQYQVQQETVESEEFAEDTLEYARTKLAGNTKKQKTCTKGYSCGFACVSKTKSCTSPLPGQAKNYADWLVNQIKMAGKLSPAHAAEAERMGLPNPLEPPEPSKQKRLSKSSKPETLVQPPTTQLLSTTALFEEHLVTTNKRMDADSLDKAIDLIATEGAAERSAAFRQFVNERQIQSVVYDYNNEGEEQNKALLGNLKYTGYVDDKDFQTYARNFHKLKPYKGEKDLDNTSFVKYAAIAVKPLMFADGYTAPPYKHVFLMGDSEYDSNSSSKPRFQANQEQLNSAVNKAIDKAKGAKSHKDKANSVGTMWHSPDTDTQRTMTYIHEIGHVVDYAAGTPKRPKGCKSLTEYSTTNEREWFAEHFTAWMLDAAAYRKFDRKGADFIEFTFKSTIGKKNEPS